MIWIYEKIPRHDKNRYGLTTGIPAWGINKEIWRSDDVHYSNIIIATVSI